MVLQQRYLFLFDLGNFKDMLRAGDSLKSSMLGLNDNPYIIIFD